MNSQQAFQLTWDGPSGNIQVRLPSGTRLNLTREHPSFAWNFLDALTQLHSRDPEYLQTPMTEKKFRYIFSRWKSNGNKALEQALKEMEPEKRHRLSDETIEQMRLKFLADGHVVIKPLSSPPKDLNLDDLGPITLNLDALK